MPRPPGSHDPYKWTLDLPPGSQCSVGWSKNENVDKEGKSSPGRPNEDRYYTCTYQDKIQLYIVLDGHDGTRACDFVQKHLPHSVLRCDLERGDIHKELVKAFRSTEREFFIGIDPHITRRLTLVIEIQQKAENSHQASMLCPQQVDEIDHLDNQIKGGTTVVLALIYNNHLYVANVGDSRALLCTYRPGYGDQLIVEQLSKDHNTANDEELRRLAECGLDPTELRRARRLGYQQNTRSIGDYSIKGGYADVESISKARREPGTAEPYVSQSINLSECRGFLILMSDGLYEAYETWTNRPLMVNDDIAQLVAQEMKRTSDLSVVAQNVVENVKSLFCRACREGQRSGRLDDITLIVRNFTPVPHTHSYPGSLHNTSQQMPSGGGGAGFESFAQDHQSGRILQSTVSYPSHMHNQPNMSPHPGIHPSPQRQFGMPGSSGSPSYYAGYHPDYHHGGQPHMSLQQQGSAVSSGNIASNDPTFYSMGAGAARTNYSGSQGVDPQNRHPHAVGGHHHYEHGGVYNQGAGGGYPSSYQHQPNQQYQQPVGGQLASGQQPRPHPPAKYTVSNPHKNIPPHPAHSQRSGSLPHVLPTSPEHGSPRHKYENVPNIGLNTIAESEPRTATTATTSPTKQSGAIYENVPLRQQQATLQQPGFGGDQSQQTNRYSDSLLAEKTREMSLDQQIPGESGSGASGVVPQPRPRSAEPSRQNENFMSISALPSDQGGSMNPADENLLMYGWTPETGGDSSSMSTLTQGTLSSSELPSVPSMGGASHTPSLPEAEVKTPVNGEIRQLGIKDPAPPPPTKSQSAESAKEDEQGEDEEWFTADMSDFSEASEAEGDDEIDAESGEIRSYIKNWGKFPLHLSWEEV